MDLLAVQRNRIDFQSQARMGCSSGFIRKVSSGIKACQGLHTFRQQNAVVIHLGLSREANICLKSALQAFFVYMVSLTSSALYRGPLFHCSSCPYGIVTVVFPLSFALSSQAPSRPLHSAQCH